MARDRERAKDRKARTRGAGDTPASDHVSGEVDAFEARVANDAGGPADAETAADIAARGGEGHPEDLSDSQFGALEDQLDDVEHAFESGDSAEIARAEGDLKTPHAVAPGTPTRKGRGRSIAFLRASWAELQRVQWPDRRQVGQATAVVLGFVVVAGLYLGLADAVAKKIVDFII